MTEGATPAWDLLLTRALIQWPERVRAGGVDFGAWTPDRDRFAHFLRTQSPYEAGRLSQTDIDAALIDLLGRARTLTELYKRLLSASGLAVEWSNGQPW